MKPSSPQKGTAFSSFAHIPDLQSLEFAVILREEGDTSQIVSRMLPMSRIVPGPPLVVKDRTKVVSKVKLDEKEPCGKMECKERRERIQSLKANNEEINESIYEIDFLIKAQYNKFEALTKSNELTSDKTRNVEVQISEVNQRSAYLEIEKDNNERQTKELSRKVSILQGEIKKYTEEADRKNKERDALLNSYDQKVIFNPKHLSRLNASTSKAELVDKILARSLDLWDREYGGSVKNQGDFVKNMIDDVERPKTSMGFSSTEFKMPIPPYLTKAMSVIRPKTSEVKGKGRLIARGKGNVKGGGMGRTME